MIERFTYGDVLRRPTLILWVLFVALQPFYLLPSGLPQPGDMLLIPLFPLVLVGWDGRLRSPSLRPFRALMWFTLWAVLVNVGWMLVSGRVGVMSKDAFSILMPAFYLYNAAVLFCSLVLYHRYDRAFLDLTFRVMFVVVIFNALLSLVYFGLRPTRGTVLFNNPNQLGYYAMISACVIALCYRRLGYGVIRCSIGLTACLYLALISASKAAVGGTALLFALALVTSPRIIIAVGLATAGLLSLGGPVSRALEVNHQRITEDRNPHASFFEERGYDRLIDHPQHLIFGAGEGATTRFAGDTLIGTHEIHSSAATILFAYGIPGVILFLLFIRRTLHAQSWRLSLLLAPPLAYTIAHQGLRFTSLWLLIGMFIAVKQVRDRQVSSAPLRDTVRV